MITESGFQNWVMNVARSGGWGVVHIKPDGYFGRGAPDLLICNESRVITAELKTESGQLSFEQRRWAKELNQASTHSYYLWRPRDAERIATMLLKGTPDESTVASLVKDFYWYGN